MSELFRDAAIDVAMRAGALLREHLGGRRQVRYKGGPTDLVTEMDRRAEALIVTELRDRFPDHA